MRVLVTDDSGFLKVLPLLPFSPLHLSHIPPPKLVAFSLWTPCKQRIPTFLLRVVSFKNYLSSLFYFSSPLHVSCPTSKTPPFFFFTSHFCLSFPSTLRICSLILRSLLRGFHRHHPTWLAPTVLLQHIPSLPALFWLVCLFTKASKWSHLSYFLFNYSTSFNFHMLLNYLLLFHIRPHLLQKLPKTPSRTIIFSLCHFHIFSSPLNGRTWFLQEPLELFFKLRHLFVFCFQSHVSYLLWPHFLLSPKTLKDFILHPFLIFFFPDHLNISTFNCLPSFSFLDLTILLSPHFSISPFRPSAALLLSTHKSVAAICGTSMSYLTVLLLDPSPSI